MDFGASISFVNRVLSDNWAMITAAVPPDALPISHAAGPRSKRRVFDELGCGHYGCVLPTRASHIVCKVTTDPTEANFVYAERHRFANRLQAFKWWAGWVRDTLVRSTNPKRLLLEAGQHRDWAYDMVELDERENVVVRSTDYKGAQRVALGLRACEAVAELSANEPEGYLVGQALGYYLDHDLLLADVHINNIGEVERDGYREPLLVITDPGHAVSL